MAPSSSTTSTSLHAGQVLGLIGEGGAGKSIGLSAMAYARRRAHCRWCHRDRWRQHPRTECRGDATCAASACPWRSPRRPRSRPAWTGLRGADDSRPHVAPGGLGPSVVQVARPSPATRLLAIATRTRPRAGNCSVRWRRWRCRAVRTSWCWTRPTAAAGCDDADRGADPARR